MNRLEYETRGKVRPVRGFTVYDRESYEKTFNKASVQHFLKFVDDVTAFVQKAGWPLDPKFNKTYCAFKHGFFNAFGVKWIGTKSFALFFKLSEKEARRVCPKRLKMTKYEDGWKEAVFRVEVGKTTVREFAPLFRAAFEALTGKK